ncbi:PASTA domain-containing protein [Streptomyces populi]
MFAIRAVAAGVSQADPFFAEDGALGKDATGARPARPVGGVQASNSPGLYGGTAGGDAPGESGGGGPGGRGGSTGGGNDGTPGPDRTGGPAPDFGGSARPGTCVVARLKEFLTDPKNSARAREWARVLDIRPDEIPGYVDRLTPVVLRHDTLVTNHAYKHGKAVPFESLLQSGIAVLVDRRGLPAVKCSCGNPLRPSQADIKKVSVGFKDGNRKWSGFREDRIVVVEPPPGKRPLHGLRLVDVDDPGRGISRPLGTEGEKDTPFDARKETTVPPVTGLTFAEASERLARAGLSLSFDGTSLPPDDSRVTSSRPAGGSALEWGSQVTLSVSGTGDGGTPGTPADTGGLTPGPDTSGTDAGSSPGVPTGGGTDTGGTDTGTAGSTAATDGSTTGTASGATAGGETETTGASTDGTTTGATEDTTTEPTTTEPTTVEPTTAGPAVTDGTSTGPADGETLASSATGETGAGGPAEPSASAGGVT